MNYEQTTTLYTVFRMMWTVTIFIILVITLEAIYLLPVLDLISRIIITICIILIIVLAVIYEHVTLKVRQD